MGVFTRFRDIVSSNINAMLDSAEDPEKMIKLMIREMEDTLVELKASCAAVIADQKKLERHLDEVRYRETEWADRAALAVDKGRDDLAREALMEKRVFTEKAEALENQLTDNHALVDQYRDDIRQLEDKLVKAREKKRNLVQRHVRAQQAKRAQEEIRRADSYETIVKFEEMEKRLDRMEAEADLVNYGRQQDLEQQFDDLKADDEIEKMLADLKAARHDGRTSGD